MQKKKRLDAKDLVLMAFLTSLLFVGQVGMSFLPNIEVVSFLVILYTRFYKKKVFFIIYAFALLEGLTYGFGVWWFGYLYVWSILASLALLLKNQDSLGLWCALSGGFGLMYGFLFAIPYFIVGGFAAGFSYWIAGISFDLLHAGGNVIVMLLLYKPMTALFQRLTSYH